MPTSVQALKPLARLRVLVVDVDSARARGLVERLSALGCDARTATQRSHWMEFRPQLTFVVEGTLQHAALAALANAIRRVADHPQRLVCIVASGAAGSGFVAVGFDDALREPGDAALLAQMLAVKKSELADGDALAGRPAASTRTQAQSIGAPRSHRQLRAMRRSVLSRM